MGNTRGVTPVVIFFRSAPRGINALLLSCGPPSHVFRPLWYPPVLALDSHQPLHFSLALSSRTKFLRLTSA